MYIPGTQPVVINRNTLVDDPGAISERVGITTIAGRGSIGPGRYFQDPFISL